jgi:hypothetical protein
MNYLDIIPNELLTLIMSKLDFETFDLISEMYPNYNKKLIIYYKYPYYAKYLYQSNDTYYSLLLHLSRLNLDQFLIKGTIPNNDKLCAMMINFVLNPAYCGVAIPYINISFDILKISYSNYNNILLSNNLILNRKQLA